MRPAPRRHNEVDCARPRSPDPSGSRPVAAPGLFASPPALPPAANAGHRFISHMTGHRVGLWLVGAFGGVGTTITLGLAAMARGLADRTGLVDRAAAISTGLPLAGARRFRGRRPRHPRRLRSRNRPRNSGAASGVFEAGWIAACNDELAAATARVRPGSHFGAGQAISKLGDWGDAEADRKRSSRPSTASPPTWPRSSSRIARPRDRLERRQHRAPVRAGRRPPATGMP